jgi:hypothetical protein
MKARGRYVARCGAVVGALAIAIFLGAAERSAAESVPDPTCSSGKPICVSVDGTPDPASRSPLGTDHYMSYSLEVSYDSESGATSNLTNLSVTVTWADVGAATTSAFVASPASDARCNVTAPRTLTCSGTPKSLGPDSNPFSYGPLVFRTATTTPNNPNDVEASATNVSVTASAKETPQPPKGGTNVAFATQTEPTRYEDFRDEDISIAGGTLATTLATSNAGPVNQLSKLPVPANATRGIFELEEADYGGGVTCPAGLACLGQHVTTVATGFAPVNLQIVYEGTASGVTENGLVVLHTRTGGTQITISAECSGELFSGLPSDWSTARYPNGCRRVEITSLTGGKKRVEVDAWDHTNGGWDFG